LLGGDSLRRCLAALEGQTFPDFEVVVVDNSGRAIAREFAIPPRVRIIENGENLGFGAAVNQGWADSRAEFLLTLNDDAYPVPEWLAELVSTCEQDAAIGMCASQIRLLGRKGLLDSAGLNIYPDGTAKQRGHGRAASDYGASEDVLLPSGCAALYRRSMIEQVGGFDPDYFLYVEDTDLGLRGRRAGWRSVYAPGAVVEHEYSKSSGRASAMKAFYVERNRLFTVVKLFPVVLWPLVPIFSTWRYLAHFEALLRGRGLAGEFNGPGERWWRLVLIVVSAYWQTLLRFGELLRKRRVAKLNARLGALEFWRLLRQHAAGAREVASQ
jgi:GT2 family glycosyltransferase